MGRSEASLTRARFANINLHVKLHPEEQQITRFEKRKEEFKHRKGGGDEMGNTRRNHKDLKRQM